MERKPPRVRIIGDTNAAFDAMWEIRPPLTCHLWTASRNRLGYARFRGKLGHGFAYRRKYGQVPTGLVLDHFVCDTEHCVNPDHVRPVTQRENILRSTGVTAINARKTHCNRGHEFTPENTYRWKGAPGASRQCRSCVRERGRT